MASKPPFNPLRLATPRVDVERRVDGIDSSCVRRNPWRPFPEHLGHHLRRWAREAPDRVFLAERAPTKGWRRVGYAAKCWAGSNHWRRRCWIIGCRPSGR